MSFNPSMADVLAEFGISTHWQHRQTATTNEIVATADVVTPSTETTPKQREDWASIGQMNLAELETAINTCTACALAENRKNVRLLPAPPQTIFWLDSMPQQVAAEVSLTENILKTHANKVYATLVRCPTPGNRPATQEENRACQAFMQRELALRQPEQIFALGRAAALALLDSEEALTLGQLRAQDWQVGGFPLTVVAHPAQMLTDGDEKRKLWEQLVKYL